MYGGWGRRPPAGAIRCEGLASAFYYVYATQQGAVFTVHGELAPSPTRPGYHVLDLAIRTPPVEDRARKPANLVFVIDVSGSMSLDDRLGLVKRSLRLLVDRLAPSDTIGVVVYGDRGRDVLEPAPLAERERILATIDSLWAEGSTNAQEGLELGYAMAERHLRAGATNVMITISWDPPWTPDMMTDHLKRALGILPDEDEEPEAELPIDLPPPPPKKKGLLGRLFGS